jgi:hypothetical protein
MYRIANEFKTRIDEWFKWRDVFIVGLEYCSTNILKISLRAVNVEVVSPNGKKWIASELHPIDIKIPFDLLGDLLDAVQKHSNYRIIGAINNNEFIQGGMAMIVQNMASSMSQANDQMKTQKNEAQGK